MEGGFVGGRDGLIMEDSRCGYVNIVGVREGDEEKGGMEKLMKGLKCEGVKKLIEEKYKGGVVGGFE